MANVDVNFEDTLKRIFDKLNLKIVIFQID